MFLTVWWRTGFCRTVLCAHIGRTLKRISEQHFCDALTHRERARTHETLFCHCRDTIYIETHIQHMQLIGLPNIGQNFEFRMFFYLLVHLLDRAWC
jgi:hypothetical protein